MKEYIKKLKELWKVPRYKALIKLGFYLIFIIFVVSLINNAPKVKEEPIETKSLYSYEFVYKITQDNLVTEINGIHYNNTEKLVNELNTYYYKDNVLYFNKEVIEDYIPFPLYKMRYDSISKLLIPQNIIDRTVYTDYELINYQVLGSNFEYDLDFVLSVEKKEDYITKATINIPEINYKIEIEYKNFNAITSLEINI